jgi:hypothetical protein
MMLKMLKAIEKGEYITATLLVLALGMLQGDFIYFVLAAPLVLLAPCCLEETRGTQS